MTTPTISETQLSQRATHLAAVVRQHADESDRLGRAAPEVVEEIIQARLSSLTLPTRRGGDEAGLCAFVNLLETVAEADASAGWVTVAAAALPLFTRTMPLAAQEEIFGTDPPLAAGSIAPVGRAEEVPGGYMVSGTWPFSTGCHHSSWLYGNCAVYRDGERLTGDAGAPVFRGAFARAGAFDILDTWHVAGMRASGSNHIELKSAFVPREFTYAFVDPAVTEGTFAQLPAGAFGGASLGAVALGNGRHAFTEFVHLATEGRSMGASENIRERPVVQVAAAEADALYQSARLFLYDAIGQLWQSLEAGERRSSTAPPCVWQPRMPSQARPE